MITPLLTASTHSSTPIAPVSNGVGQTPTPPSVLSGENHQTSASDTLPTIPPTTLIPKGEPQVPRNSPQSALADSILQALWLTPFFSLPLFAHLGNMIKNAFSSREQAVGVEAGIAKKPKAEVYDRRLERELERLREREFERELDRVRVILKRDREIVAAFDRMVKADVGAIPDQQSSIKTFEKCIEGQKKMWDSHSVARKWIQACYELGQISPNVLQQTTREMLRAIENVMANDNPAAYTKFGFQSDKEQGYDGTFATLKFLLSGSPSRKPAMAKHDSAAPGVKVTFNQDHTPRLLEDLRKALVGAGDLCKENTAVSIKIQTAIDRATEVTEAFKNQTGSQEDRLTLLDQFVRETLTSLTEIIRKSDPPKDKNDACFKAYYACIAVRDCWYDRQQPSVTSHSLGGPPTKIASGLGAGDATPTPPLKLFGDSDKTPTPGTPPTSSTTAKIPIGDAQVPGFGPNARVGEGLQDFFPSTSVRT